MSTGYLNVSKLDELSLDNEQDVQAMGQMVFETYISGQNYMSDLANQWDLNVRFFLGEQYLYYNNTRYRYELIPINKYNDWIPRPVTNLILPIVQTLISVAARNRPNATVRPNSQNPTDQMQAKTASVVQDAKWEIDDEQRKLIQSLIVLCLCGTVFRKDYWDSNAGPISELTGEPVGDNCVEIKSPFEIIPDINNRSYFIESSIQPKEWVQAHYDIEGEGYTGLAKYVKTDAQLNNLMINYNRLKVATGQNGGTSNGQSSYDVEDSCLVLEAYINPTKNHKQGLQIVYAGGKTLYAGPSKYYEENDPDSWHPYTEGFWQEVFFRYHGLAPVDNLIPLQRRINSIDSMIILSHMTTINPVWLIPKGSGVPDGYINGAPNLQIPYNPVGANGAAPQRLPGIPLPDSIFKERQEKMELMFRIAGTNEVVDGVRPTGVNTAAGLNLLLEQSFNKFSPQMQNIERYVEKGQTKKLKLIANKYKEPRPDFTKTLMRLNKDLTLPEIQNFIGQDMGDNIHVRIEAGSTLPRLKAYEQQLYMQLAGQGALGPIDPIQNPIGNEEFLQKLGIEKFDTEMNADVVKARYVTQVLTSINQGICDDSEYVPLEIIDNPLIHKKVITDAMKRPGFNDPKQVFARKMQEIDMMIQGSQPPQSNGQGSASPLQSPQTIGEQSLLTDNAEGGIPQAVPLEGAIPQGMQQPMVG